MMLSLFKRKPAKALKRQVSTPEGSVIWAVGDIHGRLDLLDALLAAMIQDLRASNAERRMFVFLGDYVDRGADSRGVLDRLCWLGDQPEFESHFLRGNHEDRMEAFLVDPEVGAGWCEYGGREALLSYGVTIPPLRGDSAGWVEASAAFNEAMPERHRDFLRRQELSFEAGDYFFAHAGAKPGVPLAHQDGGDLMWIRQGFLDHPEPFDRVIVHGHTPAEAAHADHRRIGIDTGAYATGVLTGLRLEGETRQLLQTRQAGRQISLSRTTI